MSYGIFDYDLRTYGTGWFNLELMKMAAYYKNKQEIVAPSVRFRPELYNHFIVGKDYLDEKFTLPIYEYDNIILTGRFFSPYKYHPLDLNIEKQIPDKTIYRRLLKDDFLSKYLKRAITGFLKGAHLRLSLNEHVVWKDFDKQIQGAKNIPFCFYDYDLGKVEDAQSVITDILNERSTPYTRKIAIKFPITIASIDELDKWLNFYYFVNQVTFNLNFPITNELLKYLANNIDRIKDKTFIHNPLSFTTSKSFIARDINILYYQIYFLRTLPIHFSLIYEEEFFDNRLWAEVLHLFNEFIKSYDFALKRKYTTEILQKDSMYNYAKKKSKLTRPYKSPFTKKELQEIFMFVKENNYQLFKDFYEYRGGLE